MSNIFDSIPENISDELFSDLVCGENVRIERIVSKGHASPQGGWYDQEEHEWVILLKGEAKITFETDNDVHLTPGSYLNIPAHKKHRVAWTVADAETIWLAIHYRDAINNA